MALGIKKEKFGNQNEIGNDQKENRYLHDTETT